MADIKRMTLEQLDAELTRLHTEQKRIRAEKKQVAAHLDRLISEKNMLEKLAAMSDTERHLLARMIQVGGIESESAVGVPGAG